MRDEVSMLKVKLEEAVRQTTGASGGDHSDSLLKQQVAPNPMNV